MFETNKICRFADGSSAIIKKTPDRNNHWKYELRDNCMQSVCEMEVHSERDIVDRLVSKERIILIDAVSALLNYRSDIAMPSNDEIRNNIVARLEDYRFTW